MKETSFLIRQGDVLLELVDRLPATATEQPLDKERGLVLAEGEATGHAHRVPHRYASRTAAAYRTEDDARYMRATAPVPLRHEEHKTRCEPCRLERPGEFVIATARIADRYGRDAYLCQSHAAASDADVVALAEPGATDLPDGVFRVSIHAEYQPGPIPTRDVAD